MIGPIDVAAIYAGLTAGMPPKQRRRTAIKGVLVAAGIGVILAWEAWMPIPLWPIALGLFLLSWVAQFVGHKIEGEKPSFLEDIQFLLVGPAWLLHFIYRRIGIPY